MLPVNLALALALGAPGGASHSSGTPAESVSPTAPTQDIADVVAEGFASAPPSVRQHYLRYGVAIAGDFVFATGEICAQPDPAPCILGSGGGLSIAIGYRDRTFWYIGGAYGFSEQASDNLLRLAILQRLEFQASRYLTRGNRANPYLSMNGGLALYGDEWAAATWGFTVSAGVGVEFEVSQDTLVGLALLYQPLWLHRWQDSAGNTYADGALGFGLAQALVLGLTVDLQSPLSRF